MKMAVNHAIIQGRIPFDLELKKGDDVKRAFLSFTVAVKRNYKPEGEKYFPEDLITCKAYGGVAEFIAKNFKKGDEIILEGELRRGEDYEKDGETIKGQLFFLVSPMGIHFPGKPAGNGNEKSPESAASAAKVMPITSAKKTALLFKK